MTAVSDQTYEQHWQSNTGLSAGGGGGPQGGIYIYNWFKFNSNHGVLEFGKGGRQERVEGGGRGCFVECHIGTLELTLHSGGLHFKCIPTAWSRSQISSESHQFLKGLGYKWKKREPDTLTLSFLPQSLSFSLSLTISFSNSLPPSLAFI